MIKTTMLAVIAIAAGGILAGCNSESEPTTDKTDTMKEENMATPVVFSNEKGEALCPVMGGAIADTTGLKYEDYKGKRYYFCCDECPDQFHADPAKFADGKAMPKDGGMGM